jgi:hypothetical protein
MLPSALDQYHQLEQVKYHTFRKLLYASEASSQFLQNPVLNILQFLKFYGRGIGRSAGRG